jgi:hypothetical protein
VHTNLSLKAIGAGVLLALVASALLLFLVPYFQIVIYYNITRGSPPHDYFRHPLPIVVMLLMCILQVGVSGYLAAWIANRRFILHSVIAAVVYIALATAFTWDVTEWTPVTYLLVAWSLLVAAVAGYLRGWQRRGSSEAL